MKSDQVGALGSSQKSIVIKTPLYRFFSYLLRSRNELGQIELADALCVGPVILQMISDGQMKYPVCQIRSAGEKLALTAKELLVFNDAVRHHNKLVHAKVQFHLWSRSERAYGAVPV